MKSSAAGVTGKVVGDPRINRTKAGPGRPPLWWKHRFTRYEEDATELIGLMVEQGRAKLLHKDGWVRITGKVDRCIWPRRRTSWAAFTGSRISPSKTSRRST